jgi:hypothetical protein
MTEAAVARQMFAGMDLTELVLDSNRFGKLKRGLLS